MQTQICMALWLCVTCIQVAQMREGLHELKPISAEREFAPTVLQGPWVPWRAEAAGSLAGRPGALLVV